MTWSAPTERTRSTLRVLHTPVTSAPKALPICTANVPTPPDAPLTSSDWPAWSRPTSRSPCRAVVPASGTAAACSNVQPAGLRATRLAGTLAYSANAPPLVSAQTSSPTANPLTWPPTATTSPASALPATGTRGDRSPEMARIR